MYIAIQIPGWRYHLLLVPSAKSYCLRISDSLNRSVGELVEGRLSKSNSFSYGCFVTFVKSVSLHLMLAELYPRHIDEYINIYYWSCMWYLYSSSINVLLGHKLNRATLWSRNSKNSQEKIPNEHNIVFIKFKKMFSFKHIYFKNENMWPQRMAWWQHELWFKLWMKFCHTVPIIYLMFHKSISTLVFNFKTFFQFLRL
jgi:hypothetical protein